MPLAGGRRYHAAFGRRTGIDRFVCNRFDLIIGMDDMNVENLRRLAPDVDSLAKIHRMTEYNRHFLHDHVPDPYYSGADGFELVLDLLEDACDGLLCTLVDGNV